MVTDIQQAELLHKTVIRHASKSSGATAFRSLVTELLKILDLPEGQTERDVDEEAAALTKSCEDARQARSQAWRQGVVQNALTGKIGGEMKLG